MIDLDRPSLTRRLTQPAADPAKAVQRPLPTAAPVVQRSLASSPLLANAGQAPAVQAQTGAPAAPAVQRPGLGGTAPVTRVATRPEPALKRALAGTWNPTLNSGTGASGEPVYDNASVGRMVSRPQLTRALETPAQPLAARPEPSGLQRSLLTRPGPAVASTFGQPVTAMGGAEPAPVRRPQVGLRGPDAMAEIYNAGEDREARRKLASDLDSQRFRLELIAGNPGRRGREALEALGQNAQQQAALAAGGEKLSAEAIQGRAGRDATLANTGLEQAGQDRRAEFGAVSADADRTQQLGIARMQDATKRQEIEAGAARGETITGADGTVYRVSGDASARAVTDAQGKPLRAPISRDAGALTPAQRLESINRELATATEQLTAMTGLQGTASQEQVKAQQDYVARLQGELGSARAGDAAAAGDAGGQPRQKPSWEQFQARAKAQGSRMTPEQLKAHFDQMQ